MLQIQISEKTWTELNKRKRPGESFDEVIKQVLDLEVSDGK